MLAQTGQAMGLKQETEAVAVPRSGPLMGS